jgi:hypothetical protein
MLYVIAVDGGSGGRNLDRVDAWIRDTYASWTRPFPGLWLVEGPLVADQIHTALSPLFGPEDRLLIVKGAMEAMWQGVSPSTAEWLADNFPGSLSERIPGKTEALP